MEASSWIAFAALMVTILVVSAGGLWALFNKMETNKTTYSKLIAEMKKNTDDRITLLSETGKRDFASVQKEIEAVERRAAEPVFAIREKVSNVELFIRDNFVSKREYEKDHAQLLLAIRGLQEAIEKRLDAYEDRVEKALAIVHPQGRLPLA